MRNLAVAGFILFALTVCTFTVSADGPDNPFVVNTNWTIDQETGVGYFNPGYGVDPDPGRPNYIPSYNDYDWMYTDNKGVFNNTLQELLASWGAYCQPEIDGVDVLNRIEDLQTGINRIQIVANHVILEGVDRTPTQSMFTLTFPPNFSVDTQNRYPVAISAGGYGARALNNSIFNGIPFNLTRVKDAYLFDEENHGMVYIRWNAGGFHSMGINDEARHALNEMIQLLHNQYGCDKHRIVTIGASRGAFAALTIAQNVTPEVYDYTCVAAFAKCSALSLGKLSEFPVATYPSFASIYNVNVGSGAFRYTYDPPGGMNPDLLLPAFGPETDGTPMLEKANQLSPDYPDNLLALQDKYIFLSYAAHDSFAPLNHFLDMDNWLSSHGIEHTSFISLQGGHTSEATEIANSVFKDFLDYLLNDDNFMPGDYSPPNWKHGLFEDGRNYLLDTDINQHGLSPVPVDLDELPFSVTIPYRLGCDVFGDGTPGMANEPGILILTGKDGKDWEISVRSRTPGGTYGTPHTWSGTFDQSEGAIIKWWPDRLGWDDFPVTASGAGSLFHQDNDWLEWTITYDGIDYSNFTNWKLGGQRLACETEILSSQAWSAQLFANHTLGGDQAATGFGVDAIPALPWVDLACTPVSGTAPVGITCALTAGCYAPVDRTLAYSVDITLADGTVLPAHWQGTMAIGPDETETHIQLYEYYDESCIGVNTYSVTVADVTPAPFNQPPFPPSGLTNTTSSIVTISAPISDPVRQRQWLLTANPGWTATGGWALGQPLGQGGEVGGPDPAAGYSGANVYGNNLGGDYPNNLWTEHLTSTAIDCTDSTETRLKFQRWLGVEDPSHDHAYIQVSADGGPWVTVWQNQTEIVDTGWVQVDLDISAVADGKPNVLLRWVLGPTDAANTYCGWNIDDIEIWAKQSMVPTIMVDASCIPSSGTVPFASHMKFSLSNNCDSYRRVATQVDLDLASGKQITNWRRGYQNINPQTVAVSQWNQTMPALGFVIGDNVFTFMSRDVTPVPYNQPPHAPSGSTNYDACTVTGIAP